MKISFSFGVRPLSFPGIVSSSGWVPSNHSWKASWTEAIFGGKRGERGDEARHRDE